MLNVAAVLLLLAVAWDGAQRLRWHLLDPHGRQYHGITVYDPFGAAQQEEATANALFAATYYVRHNPPPVPLRSITIAGRHWTQRSLFQIMALGFYQFDGYYSDDQVVVIPNVERGTLFHEIKHHYIHHLPAVQQRWDGLPLPAPFHYLTLGQRILRRFVGEEHSGPDFFASKDPPWISDYAQFSWQEDAAEIGSYAELGSEVLVGRINQHNQPIIQKVKLLEELGVIARGTYAYLELRCFTYHCYARYYGADAQVAKEAGRAALAASETIIGEYPEHPLRYLTHYDRSNFMAGNTSETYNERLKAQNQLAPQEISATLGAYTKMHAQTQTPAASKPLGGNELPAAINAAATPGNTKN